VDFRSLLNQPKNIGAIKNDDCKGKGFMLQTLLNNIGMAKAEECSCWILR
jgi:hypothetical protein